MISRNPRDPILSREQEAFHSLRIQSVILHIVIGRSLLISLLISKIGKYHIFEVHFTYICRHIIFDIYFVVSIIICIFAPKKHRGHEYKYIDNPVAYKCTILGYIERP